MYSKILAWVAIYWKVLNSLNLQTKIFLMPAFHFENYNFIYSGILFYFIGRRFWHLKDPKAK